MQLAWTRYAWTPRGPEGDISATLSEALQIGAEKVSGSMYYHLYRLPVDATAMATAWADQVAKAPIVSFRLTQASASLSPGNFQPVQSVNVQGGSLSVDFGRSQFATLLNLDNPAMGQQQINASGAITPQGVFQGVSGNANVAGGLSGSLHDAGYTFDKTLPAGTLTGATLWRR